MFLKLWPYVLLVVILVFGNQLEAQTDRYELGRRVKRYEVAWQSAEKAARDRSTQSMQRAVSYFFGLNFKKAGQALDSAFLEIQSAQPASDISKWTLSRKVTVQKRVTDAAAKELQVSTGEFYETKTSVPEKAKVNVVIYGDTGQVLFERTDLIANLKTVNSKSKGAKPNLTCCWKTGQIGEGDFKVSVNLLIGETSHRIDDFLYSRVTDLEKRLDSQTERIKSAKATGTPTGYQALKMWRDLARNSCQEEQLEIDYPVHRLINNFDNLCNHGGNMAKFLKASTQREFWITLRAERKQVPMRIRLPKDLSNPRPILFVFHGAGGSDDMFFETYGAGRCVDLAEE